MTCFKKILLIFTQVGFDAPQTNLTLLPVILGHEPGGTSTRTVLHFAQVGCDFIGDIRKEQPIGWS